MKQILIFAILSAIASSCDNNANKAATEKETYKKQKETLQKEEEKNPESFLAVSGFNKKNILGQTVVKGDIISRASIAIFKDVDLQLSFYSKTSALLETDKETIFEVIHPGETKDFKTKYFAPKGTDSVALTVLSAKIVTN